MWNAAERGLRPARMFHPCFPWLHEITVVAAGAADAAPHGGKLPMVGASCGPEPRAPYKFRQ